MRPLGQTNLPLIMANAKVAETEANVRLPQLFALFFLECLATGNNVPPCEKIFPANH
jgi:hypothetical protein